jgi:phosphohistidine phosphatase SixA
VGGNGRVLLVLRHAKAVYEPGLRDEDRGLTLAVVRLPGRWADAGPGGELARIWTPRTA